MRRALSGLAVLLLAAVSLVVVAAASRSVQAGVAVPRPPAPPPAVGTCLDKSRRIVSCAAEHSWEVVAAWAADDPRRRTEPGSETCDDAASGYPGIVRAEAVGGWTARSTVVAAVLQAPADRSAGPTRGWTACGVQPAWTDVRSGSIAAVRSVSDAPDLFSLCIDFVSNTGGADCRRPHDVQILGSWNDATFAAALLSGARTVEQLPESVRTSAERSCVMFAAAMTGKSDPTYRGVLSYVLALQENGSAGTTLNCIATPTAGKVLTGSITALGQRPVPLR